MPTKSGEKLLYEDLTYQIRGACFNIWREFGGVFKEKVVDRALTEELKSRGLEVENQKSIDIFYKGKKIASYIPDKIVNDSILLEIKCKPSLTKEDERQFWYYLKGSHYKIGLLINFGSQKLEIKRRIYDKARNSIRVNPPSNPRLSASTNKGFTLIEMLVAVVIFSLIIGAISGIFISGLIGQRQALVSQKLLDQTSYALEYMGRALRMARKQTTGLPACLSQNGLNYEIAEIVPGVSGLKFINHLENDDCQGFFLQDEKLKQLKGGIVYDLTSSNLEITSFNFLLQGESQEDDFQPRVTIFLEIKGTGTRIEEQPRIKIQTSISQRNLDVKYE